MKDFFMPLGQILCCAVGIDHREVTASPSQSVSVHIELCTACLDWLSRHCERGTLRTHSIHSAALADALAALVGSLMIPR